MGASMSAITPISKNPADLGEEYLGVSPPAIGAVPGAAASASHVHRVRVSSSAITGFGRMANLTLLADQSDGPALAYLFGLSELTIPEEWTIECWISSSGSLWAAMMGWAEGNGAYPQDQSAAWANSSPGNLQGWDLRHSTAVWNGGILMQGDAPGLPTTVEHCFVQGDGKGNLWFGRAAALMGPVAMPAGGAVLSSGFPMLSFELAEDAIGATVSFDEVRVSSTLRYPTSGATYAVPAAPFNPDAQTMALWHLDDVPYGQFLASGGDGTGVWVLGPTTFDATLNANNAIFAINDTAGDSTGLALDSWFGSNSNVLPGSGSGAAATVESIQGQTGNFLLVDSGGKALPVTSPEGAQQIQVVGHLMGSPEYWY